MQRRTSLHLQLANAETSTAGIGLSGDSGPRMQCYVVVFHGLVNLATIDSVVDILRRERLAAMSQNDTPEACLWRVLNKGMDMNVTLEIGHISPLTSVLGAQIAAFATAIEVQQATTSHGRTEIAVSGHLDIHDVASGNSDRGTIRFVI